MDRAADGHYRESSVHNQFSIKIAKRRGSLLNDDPQGIIWLELNLESLHWLWSRRWRIARLCEWIEQTDSSLVGVAVEGRSSRGRQIRGRCRGRSAIDRNGIARRCFAGICCGGRCSSGFLRERVALPEARALTRGPRDVERVVRGGAARGDEAASRCTRCGRRMCWLLPGHAHRTVHEAARKWSSEWSRNSRGHEPLEGTRALSSWSRGRLKARCKWVGGWRRIQKRTEGTRLECWSSRKRRTGGSYTMKK